MRLSILAALRILPEKPYAGRSPHVESLPHPIGPEHFVRAKLALVFHRPTSRDVVPEVNVRKSPLESSGEERQDVERSRRSVLLRWVVVAVDRREGLGQGIHISNGDQPVP